jgi:WD40 repeat protein
MRASVVRSVLIAVVTTSLFGTVPAVAGDEIPSGSTGAALDTPGATLPGATLWAKRYARGGNDEATALGVSPDGSRVFVTGYSAGSATDFDYATIAYDASTGAKLWLRRYAGNLLDIATDLAVSPDGSRVFVTGYSDPSTTGYDYDYATVAYDASTGATLWSVRYNGPGNLGDHANALGVSPDGSTVFVTGYSNPSTSLYKYDFATVAYDASTGARLWAVRYAHSGNEIAYALGVSPDGSEVFVTGTGGGSTGSPEYATVAYEVSTGAQLWAKHYDAQGADYAFDLGVSPDGSAVFVTGSSDALTNGYDYTTVAYDAATGARLWLRRYNGPGNYTDFAEALGVSPDGSEVFVTGGSDGSTSGSDIATVAYDASSGAKLWARRYHTAGGSASAAALGMSADGSKVFVTGTGVGATSGSDYATVAYDASSGAKLWARSYRRPGEDYGGALAVSPDGSAVFVTGSSAGSTSGRDYATVAYRVA